MCQHSVSLRANFGEGSVEVRNLCAGDLYNRVYLGWRRVGKGALNFRSVLKKVFDSHCALLRVKELKSYQLRGVQVSRDCRSPKHRCHVRDCWVGANVPAEASADFGVCFSER